MFDGIIRRKSQKYCNNQEFLDYYFFLLEGHYNFHKLKAQIGNECPCFAKITSKSVIRWNCFQCPNRICKIIQNRETKKRNCQNRKPSTAVPAYPHGAPWQMCPRCSFMTDRKSELWAPWLVQLMYYPDRSCSQNDGNTRILPHLDSVLVLLGH